MTDKTRLKQLLRPRSAVFIGGSRLSAALDYCRANQFEGEMYVVNPFRSDIAGLPCYPTIADLPTVPDLGFVSVPKEAVIETVAALAKAGVAGAICNSAGFSEIAGEGIELQEAFVMAAGEMPVIGPNCPGMANFVDRSVFMQDHFGDHVGVTGGVAVISNGGAYLSDLGTAQRSLPLAYSIGMGNQAVLSVADLFDAILDDERVQAVNLYLESVQDVTKLSQAALKALEREVPVVVVKGGRSQAGQRATQSHTASLAGDDVVLSALFDRLGFIRCATPDEAIETLKMLIFTGRPAGRRLAFNTSSGTYAVLGSDTAESAGLEITPLPGDVGQMLEPLLPAYLTPGNPLDIADGQAWDADRLAALFDPFLTGPYDMAVQVMCFPPDGGTDAESWYGVTDAFARSAKKAGLPCAFVNTLADALPQAARERMIANGMVPLQGLRSGFQAIANAALYNEILSKFQMQSIDSVLMPAAPVLDSTAGHQLNEAESKAILKQAGVLVPQSLHTVEMEKPWPLADLTYPVVVKAVSNQLLHKSEYGAVILNIQTPEDVLDKVFEIQERFLHDPTVSFLIEEMVTDSVAELLVSVRHISGIGQALTLGLGGVMVELYKDTQTILLPASLEDIRAALRALKYYPLFVGWRGKPAADLDQIVQTINQIGTFAQSQQNELLELEINPLIVRSGSQPPVAVDALVQLAKK